MDEQEAAHEAERKVRRDLRKSHMVAQLRMFKRMMLAPPGSPGERTYAEALADLVLEDSGY